MKNRISYVLFFLFIFSAYSNTRGKQELIKSGSHIYDLFTAISLETGITSFTEQTPISIGEFSVYLREIDYDSLSESGKLAYEEIKAYFEDENLALDSDILSIGLEPYVNLEGYYKTNAGLDWIYNRYERKPFLYAPLVLSTKDYFTIKLDLYLAQNKGTMNHFDNYVNIPLSLDQFDVNFPDSAYFSCGGMFSEKSGFNFQLGMGSIDMGRSLSGSIIRSRYMTGTTYANLDIFSPILKFNTNISQLNVDKYVYTHQLDFRLFKKFQFSVLESLFVYAPIELRYMNPLTIFHGMSPWKDYGSNESNTADYLAIRFTYVPWKYFRLYGAYAMNQFQTYYERTNWPEDVTPNGIGFQFSIESYVPISKGYFHAWLEGSYADPFLYIKESPNWSLMRTYEENIGDLAIFYEWVGSPFGPDTIAGELNIGYEIPSKFSVTLSYLFKVSGEYSDTKIFKTKNELGWGGSTTSESNLNYSQWIFPVQSNDPAQQAEAKRKQSLVTPSGIPEYLNRISVRGEYTFKDYIKLTVQPGFVFVFNKNNTYGKMDSGFEITAAVSLNLLKGIRGIL